MALERILAAKRTDVAARMRDRPLAAFRDGLVPSDRDFVGALRARRPAFICEIKPASPSEGPLRPVEQMGPAIAGYARHADVVSVLADHEFFGGSLALLRAVRRQLPQPVLCKDFVIDPYQVFEAREAGADAVLLMLSILDDATYCAARAAAESLGMGVLTEVHSGQELDRALALGASVIGINNRNLATLTVDLDTTPALAARVPPGITVIAESGVRTRADVRRLVPYVDGFLVGTALMKATDPDHALRGLVYGPTKICGLTRGPDVEAAALLGATHGGFIFAAESPRAITLAQARDLRKAAPLQFVGVFVDETPARVASVAGLLDLAAVQLHGEESREYRNRLRQLLPGNVEIWKALRVAETRPAPTGADRTLLDRFDPARRGGTGRPFDWSLLTGLPSHDHFILSGGIGPGNAADAGATGIDFLDANSGVESAPGLKSAAAIERLFAVRRATTITRQVPA